MRRGFLSAVLSAAVLVICLSTGPRLARAQETPDAVNLQQDISYIEKAYMNVIRYYNGNLTDLETSLIARSILYYSSQYGVDARLVVSVIVVESRFRPRAVSRKGAMGLGQLMPGTARMLGVTDPFDIQQNVAGTVRYLRAQYDRFSVSYDAETVLDFMLAAYNAGPEAVERSRGIPPYRETQNYVVQVKRLFRYFVYGNT